MKTSRYTDAIESNEMYHIYNRGINGTNLFYKPDNYVYFLTKYAHYLGEILETYAYCLLANHFHLLVRVKDDEVLKNLLGLPDLNLSGLGDLTGFEKKGLHHPDKIVSKKFSDFFNSYTKSINKAIGRTGGLFETPFKRIKIDNEAYFSSVLAYIHFNPQKHGFVDDFRDYQYSSYQSHMSLKPSKLMRQAVLDWFGNKAEYENFHVGFTTPSEYAIEFD